MVILMYIFFPWSDNYVIYQNCSFLHTWPSNYILALIHFTFFYVFTWLLPGISFVLKPNSCYHQTLWSFFISFSLLIWLSPKSFWLNFWIPVSFLILPPYLLVVQLLSILCLKYLLFNLFHFILITTTIFNVLISKNSQNLYFQDLFILIKSIEDSKEPCLYVLTLIHI